MSTKQQKETLRKQNLWKVMQPILKQHPNGIPMNVLSQQINANQKAALYSHDFICSFMNEMEAKHRLIAFLSTDPYIVTMRLPKDANKLIKLNKKHYDIYKQIEKSQREGIIMHRLLNNMSHIPKPEIHKTISKILQPQNLTTKFKHIRNNKIHYIATSYEPQPHAIGGQFHKDKDFLTDIFMIVLHQIKTCKQMEGVSCGELLNTIQISGVLNDNCDLSINEIELVTQLLIYEKRICIIPCTVPRTQLDSFLTPSKNTFYHLMKAVQAIRYKETEEEKRKSIEMRDGQKWKKKRKLNDGKAMKIKMEYDVIKEDDENEEVLIKEEDGDMKEGDFNKIDIGKYSDIKFRYNNYSYESPFSEIPCQSCPVAYACSDGGVINPTDCPYLNAWLNI